MTLEEAEKEFTQVHRTAIHTVGADEIGVKKRLPYSAGKPYVAYYASDPKNHAGFNGQLLGEFDNLEEAKTHLMGLSFASDIDPNGWVVSQEEG